MINNKIGGLGKIPGLLLISVFSLIIAYLILSIKPS